MAFIPPYTDISFADLYNSSEAWSLLNDAQKDFALSFARSYIDKNYTCLKSYTETWNTDDLTTIPDNVQWANAVIAEKYALGELSGNEIEVSGPITHKKVKAGSVESETTYLGSRSTSAGSSFLDYKDVTNMLSPYCTLGNSGNLTRV